MLNNQWEIIRDQLPMDSPIELKYNSIWLTDVSQYLILF